MPKQRVVVSVFTQAPAATPATPLFVEELYLDTEVSPPRGDGVATAQDLSELDGLLAAAKRSGVRAKLIAALVEARAHDADSVAFMSEKPVEHALLADLRRWLRRTCETDAVLSSRALLTPPRLGEEGDDAHECDMPSPDATELADRAMLSATRARRRDLCVTAESTERSTVATLATNVHAALLARAHDAENSGINTPKTPQDVASKLGLPGNAPMVPVASDAELHALLEEADSLMPLHLSLVCAPVLRFRLGVAAPVPDAPPGTMEPPPTVADFTFDAPWDVPDEATLRRLVYLVRGAAGGPVFVAVAPKDGADAKDISLGADSTREEEEESHDNKLPTGLEMVRIELGDAAAAYTLQTLLAAHVVPVHSDARRRSHSIAGRRGSRSSVVPIPPANAMVFAMDAAGSAHAQFTVYSRAHQLAAVAVQCLLRKVFARRIIRERREKHKHEMDRYHQDNLEMAAATLLQSRMRGLFTRKATGVASAVRPAKKAQSRVASDAHMLTVSDSDRMPSWAARPITESTVEALRAAASHPEYGSEQWLRRQAQAILIQCAARRWFARTALAKRKAAIAAYLEGMDRMDEASAATRPGTPARDPADLSGTLCTIAAQVPPAPSGGRALSAVFSVAMLAEMTNRGATLLWGVHLLHDTVNDDFLSRRTNFLPQRLPELQPSRWFVSIRKQAADAREVALAKQNLTLKRHGGGHRRPGSPPGLPPLATAKVPKPPVGVDGSDTTHPSSARLARAAKHKALTAAELEALIRATHDEVSDAHARVRGRLAERDRQAREAFRRSKISLAERTERPRPAEDVGGDGADGAATHRTVYHSLSPARVSPQSTTHAGTGAPHSARVGQTPKPPPTLQPINAAKPAGQLVGTTRGADLRRRSLHQQQQLAPSIAGPSLGEHGLTTVVDGNDPEDDAHTGLDDEQALRDQKRAYLSAICRVHDDRLRQQRRSAAFKR